RVALAQGRTADALAEARSGLATLDAASGPQHVDTAFAHDLLGDVLLELGRAREAHEHHSMALAGVEPALGADHHDLAHVLEGLARSALANDLPGEAMAAATRALAIVEREGVVHLELAHTLALLAVIERGHGRPAQAAAHAARARGLVDLLRERASDAARFDADPIARWIRAVDANANPAVGGPPPERVSPVTPPVKH
ncbi:MAG: tetratricopeptide repeat protein, partial [Deltaproteobacteria bacterium]|nr:tetratricopeptide repeat protein [Nannocystaceae bacterium]